MILQFTHIFHILSTANIPLPQNVASLTPIRWIPTTTQEKGHPMRGSGSR